MRISGITYLLFFFLCLSGCNDETDYGIGEYRVDLVKINSGTSFSMLNSSETSLLSENELKNATAGKRVLLNYSITGQQGNSQTIRINSYSAVFCDTIIPLSKAPNMGNDPINFESAWIGLNYLNIDFYGDYHSDKVAVALMHEKTTGATAYLTFRYDKLKDPPGSRSKFRTSFDISNVLGLPDGSKTVVVSFNAGNYKPENYTLTFKY